jgi:hypothetical protein
MGIGEAAGGFLNAVFSGRGKLTREVPTKVSWTPNGDMPAATPEPLVPLRPSMRGRLPKGMAELLVYPTGDSENFGLLGACGDKLVEPLGAAGRPELDLNSLALQLEREQPVISLPKFGSWSREKKELVDWLNRLRGDAERDSTELELVVWDDTGFRIPWELFWLSDPEKRRNPNILGALMTVTRWLTIRTSNIVQDFTKDPGQASGPIAAYVHKDMADDMQLFRDFEVEYANSMGDLLTRLGDQNGAALAMVYAACDGEFGDRPGQSHLGWLLLENANMAADYGFDRLHNRQTLVFLNACASGPVGEDRQTYNDGALRGFPKMFLETGAAGVLATAAPIENNFARQAAEDLFQLLRAKPSLPVARAVRELRQQAARSLDRRIWLSDIPAREQLEANKTLAAVLRWSMYLYYGSPRMTISFTSANTSPASD